MPSTQVLPTPLRSQFYLSRFLTSGDSYQTIAGQFRRSPCTISVIVTRVCDAMWTKLVNKVMPKPTEQDWEQIETGFRLRWNLSNCCGAVDSKHVAVRQPPGSGSLFFNYNKKPRGFMQSSFPFLYI